MKTVNAHCFTPGVLSIGTKKEEYRGFDSTGAYAAYEFFSPEALAAKASSYDWVQRPNGEKVKGRDYTIRKAKFDWSASAI